ncbi:MAG: helix-turn-helix transcriptional regulator [Bacteroidales bacterium]|jgi:transcriptional regulator with XRE-family HTH domain
MKVTDDVLKNVGKRLKEAREKQRFSQKELAEIMDVIPNQYSKVETGRVTPSLKTLVKAAQALKISIDELIFGEKPIEKPQIKNPTLAKNFERIEKLGPEELYFTNELLKLVLTRDSLKSIVGDYESVPLEFLKKHNK